MKKAILIVAVLVAGLFLSAARADVLVLVHGYLGGAWSWDTSGVTAVLEQHGWRRAGVFVAEPPGTRLIPAAGEAGKRKFYSVDLPSEAPIEVQAVYLRQVLDTINRRYPHEPVHLAAHSAGGVAARLALVRGDVGNIRTLITIASPHLGTGRAAQALDVTDVPFPLSLIPDFFGGSTWDTARRSRALYVDLVPQRPGSLLFWLNSVPHPDIAYYSVVRGTPAAVTGDYVVPGFSQDMNNVPALRGRSALVRVNSSYHGLSALDGSVIAGILEGRI